MGNVDFEKLAQELASARGMLKARVDALETEITKLKRQHLPAIRKWAENAATRQQELQQAIKDNPEEFVKPRTRILHGIKFGWQKQKGQITYEDEARVVALIRKHFPDQEGLIKITETPIKSGLGQLAAADLKKLGVVVEKDTDEVIIKFTDSEIDKIVEAILKTEIE